MICCSRSGTLTGGKTHRQRSGNAALPGFSSSLRSSPSTPGCCCSSSWVLALPGGVIVKNTSHLLSILSCLLFFHHVLTYKYTSSDSFLTYICFFRMRLNQSTIRGSIMMSPSPSKRQRFLTTSVVCGGGGIRARRTFLSAAECAC